MYQLFPPICNARRAKRVSRPAPGSRGWAAKVTVIITPVADIMTPRFQLAHLVESSLASRRASESSQVRTRDVSMKA
jgi:hypothetical protein